jgi:hypothetical protein
MKSTNQTHETQQDSAKITGAIDRFYKNFHLATILNQSGFRKTKGISALTIMSSIFALAFIGKDFYRGKEPSPRKQPSVTIACKWGKYTE